MQKRGALLTLLLIFSAVTGAVQRVHQLAGELEPKTYDEYSYTAEYGKTGEFRARFRPKNLRDRSADDCSRFFLRMYVDGKEGQTITGTYIYVEEAPGREVLACVVNMFYGPSRGNPRPKVELRIVNQNIFLATWTLESNYSLTRTEP